MLLGTSDFTIKQNEKKSENLKNQALKKAYNLLANYLIRVNNSNFEHRFRYWKNISSIHFQKLKLLNKQITHKRKY